MKTKQQFIDELKDITKNYNFDVENMTQQTDDWFNLKLGVISASHAEVFLKKGKGKNEDGTPKVSQALDEYMMTLITQVLTGKKHNIGSQSMDWGNDNEPLARAEFEMQKNIEVFEAPVIFKDKSMRCLISPDLLSENGGGEIKCPWNSINHTRTMLREFIKPEYIAQMQFSMWVTDEPHWDFISFDPRFPDEKLMKVIRVNRDEDIMTKFDMSVSMFIKKMDEILLELGVKFGDQWKNFRKEEK